MWAEIDVFEGRMFVTRGQGTTGVHVDNAVSDEDLGQVIVEHLSDSPYIPLDVPKSSPERGPWQIFCEEVVGVRVRRFRPEKRVRAVRTAGGWLVDAKLQDMNAPSSEVDDSAGLRGLGAAVRRELAALEPRWPTIRTVMIMTAATGQLVVLPNVDGYRVGPARVIGPDATAAVLCETVRAALADADVDRDEAEGFESALASAGLDPQLLNGGADVGLRELSDGTVQLSGLGISGGKGVASDGWRGRIEDLAQVCAVASTMIRNLPTQHLPPGTIAGSSFGYKCRWLAVRGRNLAEVAAAIGLIDARPADWDEGVHAAYGGAVFVSPPTADWVLVVSATLPFDGLTIATLSSTLHTEVQFFGTHRVSETHEWAYATGGRLIRRLACEGMSGTFEQDGEPTPVEIDLGVPAMTQTDWRINEQTVMQVAAAWSHNPTRLNLVESSARTGLCGTVPGAL